VVLATPIIYPWTQENATIQADLQREPVHTPGHLASEICSSVRSATGAGCWRSAASIVLFPAGYWLFDRLRDSFAESYERQERKGHEGHRIDKLGHRES
jgi:hypothetical protein